MTDNAQSQERRGISRTLVMSMSLVVGMFVFAVFIMPPIYNLFCELTGLNGKTKGKYQAVESAIDTSRTVNVQFVAINNEQMPWQFKPVDFSVAVHPGEAVTSHFVATNLTDRIMVAQAIPSLVPHNATDFFHKTECFCFNQQVLGPGESAELGLQFIVDQAIPKAVNTITLSYTLFDITSISPDQVAHKQMQLNANQQSSTDKRDAHTSRLLANSN